MTHDPSRHPAFPMLTQQAMGKGMEFEHSKMIENLEKLKNQTLGHVPKTKCV
jgi:hypothetical protein